MAARIAAAVLSLTVLVAGCGAEPAPDLAAPTTTVLLAPSSTVTTAPPPTTTTTAAPTTTTAPVRELRVGDTGDDVRELEADLDELGYWPGPVEGTFDTDTEHAVVALEKAAELPRDGVVDVAVHAALAGRVLPVVERTSGRHVEVQLAQQLVVVVQDGVVLTVLDTSTGSRPGSTPTGRWSITREIDALRRSPLGLLYRPKYFVRGVALHGYTSVPPTAASHGCVRLTYHAMDQVWEQDLMPIGTPVIVV